MEKITGADYAEFITAAHRAGAERLMLCSSGNMSKRIGTSVLISGTGSWLPRIKKENIAVCQLDSGNILNGIKLSMENGFHLGVMRARKDVNVVLHFQSEYATAVACMKDKPANFNVIAEVPCYIGAEVPVVPYFRPGSKELANAVVEALTNHDAVMLTNHGQVVCGKDYDDVFQKACFLELACRIIVHTQKQCTFISEEQIKDLDYYILGKGK